MNMGTMQKVVIFFLTFVVGETDLLEGLDLN